MKLSKRARNAKALGVYILDRVSICKDRLLKELSSYGAFLWHTSKNGSVYIKFKDVRLCSIRISDHVSLKKYSYKYEINTKMKNFDELHKEMEEIVFSIYSRAESINGFNPNKYIVYSSVLKDYIEVDSIDKYKKHIRGKK